MKSYIGVKLVKAEAMTKNEFRKKTNGIYLPEKFNEPGYRVQYPDGYESWCPGEQFERANIQLREPNKINEADVAEFIKDVHVETRDGNTTLVTATLSNGYKLVEASSCVDPANYSEDIGRKVCLVKIVDKVWFLLGFLLACGMNGFSPKRRNGKS